MKGVFMSNHGALPKIDDEHCIGCGDCAVLCPHGVLVMQAHRPVFRNPQQCDYCTLCEQTCPSGAVRCEFEIIWNPSEQGNNV